MKRAVLVLIACASALPLYAGIPNADCSHPFVFRDARVNVVVLPYRNQSVSSPELQRASEQLTLLLQQTILFSALKYPGTASIRMLAPNQDVAGACNASVVADKILGKTSGAEQQLGPDGAAILLWGQIYKEGDRIYLCSYALLVKRGSEIQMESTGGGHGVFVAKLPSDAVTLPTRGIATGMLDQIAGSFRKSAALHRERSFTSPAVDLPMDPQVPFPYQVLEATADGWMHIRGMDGGMSGWIYANEALRSDTLTAALPELRYVDGAIGFLEFAKASDPSALTSRARSALEAFTGAAEANKDTSLAVATAKSMMAMIFQRDPALRSRGYQLARDAVGLVPYNADARNLELVYRLGISGRDIYQPGKWRPFAEELAQAAALGPGKKYILDNLDSFYAGVLAAPGLADAAAVAEIRSRRNQLALLRTPVTPR